MSDNDIKKALECCSKGNINACVDCPFMEQCEKDESISGIALDLINRLEAEVKEKEELLQAQADTIFLYEKVIKDKTAEIERLRHEYSNAVLTIKSKQSFIEYLQDYAKNRGIEEIENRGIKKFARRLKAEMPLKAKYHKLTNQMLETMHVAIDNLVKELTEKDFKE